MPDLIHKRCASAGAARLEPAFAKINLGLQVLQRRTDGFHSLRTVFQSVAFFDDVRVQLSPGRDRSVQLRCDRKDLDNQRNLAWRAADRLLRRLSIRASIRIDLRKRIPVGAGLGGGSSDAGAVLRALARLLPERPPARAVYETARELGSDIPYFLIGGTVGATGRGTRLRPLPDLTDGAVVLALPSISVSTAWAYAALAEGRASGRLTEPSEPGILGDVGSWPAALGLLTSSMTNDFEEVVFARHPVLRDIKRAIRSLGARHALLSGSGSAVFGMFDSAVAAEQAAQRLEVDGVRARAASLLPRSRLGEPLAQPSPRKESVSHG